MLHSQGIKIRIFSRIYQVCSFGYFTHYLKFDHASLNSKNFKLFGLIWIFFFLLKNYQNLGKLLLGMKCYSPSSLLGKKWEFDKNSPNKAFVKNGCAEMWLHALSLYQLNSLPKKKSKTKIFITRFYLLVLVGICLH